MSGYVTTGDTAIPVPDTRTRPASPDAPAGQPAPPEAGTPEVGTPDEEGRRRRWFLLFMLLGDDQGVAEPLARMDTFRSHLPSVQSPVEMRLCRSRLICVRQET